MTLDKCPATIRLQLGAKLTQGFGADGDPVVGESAARESEEDIADLKSTLKDKGYGMFGIGIANEEETIIDAVEKAISSPLLETNITGATNILLNTSGRIDIVALNKAVTYIREQAGENVNIFWGTVSGEDAPQEIVVTVIATGMNQAKKPEPASRTISVANKVPVSKQQCLGYFLIFLVAHLATHFFQLM